MGLTSRREFVKGAAASCIALANIEARSFDSGDAPACQTLSLPTSLAISVPSSKPPLRASMDLREPSSIMRSKSPSG